MSHIRLVGAGAGSGKTYKLATEVFEGIRDKKYRADGIVLTTFTKRAASELKDRVAARLIQENMPDAAQRIGQSLIGTVDSVCGQIIKDFAFECGLAMDLNTIDPDMASTLFERALRDLLSENEQAEISKEMSLVGIEGWMEIVESICDRARINLIGPKELANMADDSAKSLFAGVAQIKTGREAYISAATPLLKKLSDAVDSGADKVAGTIKGREYLQRSLAAASNTSALDWGSIASVCSGTGISKRSPHLASNDQIRDLAAQCYQWPEFKESITAALKHLFEIAGGALAAHARVKTELDSVDFTDVAVMTLKALDNEFVRDNLANRVDVLMVDEFQDTSPAQMAIFAKLSGIIKNVIWVGDPKQAIYGFRGADADLMLTTIETLSKSATIEKLEKSYRSRPELVEFVNKSFKDLFIPIGIQPADVRLIPNRTAELKSKPLESWILQKELNPSSGKTTQNATNDAEQIATKIREVIDSGQYDVIDRKTGKPRKIEPRDIAVFARANKNIADDLAPALNNQGIPIRVSAAGLASLPEVAIVMSTMALLIDPRDRYAAADIRYQLNAFVDKSFDPDQWFKKTTEMRAKDSSGICDPEGRVKTITESAERTKILHPLELFDVAVDLSGAMYLTHGMANPPLAKFNIEQARGIIADYLDSEQAAGNPATVRGAISNLNSLSADNSDDLTPLGENAVTITTYQSSKGLEWPMVILFALDTVFEPEIFEVRVTTPESFDIKNPLKGREIRYWPNPFSTNASYAAMIQGKSEYLKLATKQRNEMLRLLYVGMTRARDYLVFVARPDKLSALAIMTDAKGKATISIPQDPDNIPAEEAKLWKVLAANAAVKELKFKSEPLTQSYLYSDNRSHKPGWLTPSSAESDHSKPSKISAPDIYAERLAVKNTEDYDMLGNALHGFLAVDRKGLSLKDSESLAEDILQAHGMIKHVDPSKLVQQADRFETKLKSLWPDATVHRETPIRQFTDGAFTRGFADMILETKEGLIVIDHKSFGGTAEASKEKAKSYAGQLSMYRDVAERATGKKVVGCYVNFVVLGSLVGVGA